MFLLPIASVVSTSTNASGTDAQRLQWDNGADLGYFEGGIMNQKQAAGKLSTMERDLIGNYSNFQKRMEPEGKPTSKIVGRGQQLLNRLPGGQDHEEDLRQMRLHKFADSLMKQRANAAAAQERKLSRQNVQTSSKDSGVASNTATTVTQIEVSDVLHYYWSFLVTCQTSSMACREIMHFFGLTICLLLPEGYFRAIVHFSQGGPKIKGPFHLSLAYKYQDYTL